MKILFLLTLLLLCWVTFIVVRYRRWKRRMRAAKQLVEVVTNLPFERILARTNHVEKRNEDRKKSTRVHRR